MPDNPYQLMRDVGIMMEAHLGVTCTAESITEAINQLREVFLPRAEKLRTHDATAAFNQELCAILEARNLVRVSLALATATASREESRGSLYRADFPERDDAHFLAHSFVNAHGEISYRPVVIEDYPPERRSY
jgi:succinate dehydrogenase / fumarate reductase flavoprotein subunit